MKFLFSSLVVISCFSFLNGKAQKIKTIDYTVDIEFLKCEGEYSDEKECKFEQSIIEKQGLVSAKDSLVISDFVHNYHQLVKNKEVSVY